MSETLICKMPGRALISLSGDETRSFLQGLVTNDMDHVSPARALYTALLTPQGKILFDFFVIGDSTGFLIDCASDRRDDLIKRLTFYKLRAQVDIAPVTDGREIYCVFSQQSGGPAIGDPGTVTTRDDVIGYVDPRSERAGLRIIGTGDQVQTFAATLNAQWSDAETYRGHRIGLGLAGSLEDIGSGAHFPHDCNLDKVNGVDFQKGCYVGQEVVSRMHHKTTIHKRMMPVSIAGDGAGENGPLAMTAGGKPVGTLLSRAAAHGIALVRTDRARAALDAGAALMAGDLVVSLDEPVWESTGDESERSTS